MRGRHDALPLTPILSPKGRGGLLSALLLLLSSATAFAAPCNAVDLSVLSYNTRGLPAWIAFDSPATRLEKIGRRLDGYDVALVQEDFYHHEALVRGAHHPIIIRGSGPADLLRGISTRLCPWCGSGLSIFAALPPERLVEVTRESFEACSGWIAGRADCWVAKGILRARLDLGVPECDLEVDVYDVHFDAGTGKGDREARRRQLEQLGHRMTEDSGGRAVILGGDFNSWPTDDDRQALDAFTAALDLRPAPIPPITPGFPPVDRIFYRGGDTVGVEALAGTVPEDFVDDGRPLSDHLPLQASFRLSARAAPSAAPSPDRKR